MWRGPFLPYRSVMVSMTDRQALFRATTALVNMALVNMAPVNMAPAIWHRVKSRSARRTPTKNDSIAQTCAEGDGGS